MEITANVTIGNILTIAAIVIGIVAHIVIVTSKLSEFKGVMTTRVDFLAQQVSQALGLCKDCGLPRRIERVEIVQTDRTAQLAGIAEWMESVDRRLENIETEMKRPKP